MTEVERVELAPGYSIARIINGCWQLSPGHGGGPQHRKASLRRFAELFDHGFTTFDCADIYPGTEELLREFRRTLADPDTMQVHTKLVPNKLTLETLNAQKIDAAIDLSLRKLGVERIDLVQFHWWNYAIAGLDQLYERLLRAQETGKVRLLGVTNFNTDQLMKLQRINPGIATMQAQYSMLDRRPERGMASYCASNGVALLAYGTLAGGFLSEKHLGEYSPANSNRSLQKYRLIIDDAGGWHQFQQLLKTLDGIATKHASTIDQIAARWVLDQNSVAAIILGTGRRSHAETNQSLFAIELDTDDQRKIGACLKKLTLPDGDPYDLERDESSVHSQIIRTELQEEAVT